jgi:hypothetical protein
MCTLTAAEDRKVSSYWYPTVKDIQENERVLKRGQSVVVLVEGF